MKQSGQSHIDHSHLCTLVRSGKICGASLLNDETTARRLVRPRAGHVGTIAHFVTNTGVHERHMWKNTADLLMDQPLSSSQIQNRMAEKHDSVVAVNVDVTRAAEELR